MQEPNLAKLRFSSSVANGKVRLLGKGIVQAFTLLITSYCCAATARYFGAMRTLLRSTLSLGIHEDVRQVAETFEEETRNSTAGAKGGTQTCFVSALGMTTVRDLRLLEAGSV